MKDAEITGLIKKAKESLGAAKQLLQSGLLPVTLHRYISEAFDIRQAGDYGHIGSVSEEIALILTDQAKEIIEAIEEYLKNQGYEL